MRPNHGAVAAVLRARLTMASQALICATGLLLTAPAMAMADSAHFNISAQPLPAALKAFAVQANGAEITTVEGLADGERLSPLQEEFRRHHALQCGYCTPGMLMTAKALLDANARPTRAQIASAISGNLCRCTGYTAIYEAIEKAAARS